MKLIFLSLICFLFVGCSAATKTKEWGGGISNINHPFAVGVGAIVYSLGKSLEDKPEEIDTTVQVYDKEDLEVKF